MMREEKGGRESGGEIAERRGDRKGGISRGGKRGRLMRGRRGNGEIVRKEDCCV